MEVIQVPNRPAFRAFYSVAGRLLFVESCDYGLSDLLEPLFAGWQLTPVTLPDKASDVQISFSYGGEQLPPIPAGFVQFEIAEGGQCYTDGAALFLKLRGALLQLEPGNPVAVSVSLERLPDPGDPLLARVASFAVCAALRRYGLFDLHSAGVVNPQSKEGVLIIGPSGSGKSTLAMQLALTGWSYLSDDELLLSVAAGRVEARGFRSFFALGDTGLASKTCFDPDTLGGGGRVEQMSPGKLLFTRVSGDSASELVKLTQAETMARLLRACPWATYDTAVAGTNLELLSLLAKQVRAFDLAAGRDLLTPGYASDLLQL